LQKRLLELGIAEEKAVVIVQRQRDLDAAERRRQEL
jgi:Fe2+ transport system protein FeoA